MSCPVEKNIPSTKTWLYQQHIKLVGKRLNANFFHINFLQKRFLLKFTTKLVFWEENLLHPKPDDELLVLDVPHSRRGISYHTQSIVAETRLLVHLNYLLKQSHDQDLSRDLLHVTEIRNSASIHMMTKNPNRLVPFFQQLTEVSCSS